MKLENISRLLIGAAALVAMSVWLWSAAWIALDPKPASAMILTTVPYPTVSRGPPTTSAQLLDYGTTKDTFQRGERAAGFITIKNTGNMVINDVTASVSAAIKLPIIGATKVGSLDHAFTNLDIQPGETRRVDFAVDIPASYKGVSTAGDYTLHVTVRTGGRDIGSFSKSIKVV